MPLTERDVNTHRDVPRNKRHSIQSDLSYTRLKDENSPAAKPSSSKQTVTTPPSQRLLAPTKASAAKVTLSPRAAGPSTPQNIRYESRLPRRTTPSTTPVTARFTYRAESPVQTPDIAAEMGSYEASKDSQQGTLRTGSRFFSKPMTNKPLPSPPVISFRGEMTPSKAGRTLLDASEQPVRQSSTGKLEEWPTIKPKASRPESSIATNKSPDWQPSISEAQSSTAQPSESIFSPDRWAPEVPHALISPADDAASHYSSGSGSSASFDSVADGSPSHLINQTSSEPTMGSEAYDIASPGQADLAELQDGTDPQANSGRIFSARRSSLSAQSDGTMVEYQEQNTQHPMPGFTSMLRGEHEPTRDRPHSPSPASFSRPRPSSVAQGHQLCSPRSNAENAARAVKAEKTASRIPIPDTKKANLVEIRSRSNNSTPTGRLPTFGSRRLDAPDTLKILDQGIKRRQLGHLQHKATDGSLNSQISTGTRTTGPADLRVSRSRASTPDDTFGTSSSDEEEITTPTFQPGFYAHPAAGDTAVYTPTHRHSAAFRLFDGAATALAKTPPPTSPFTGPLQTIPSEAALPFYTPEDAPPLPTHLRKPSRFEEFIKRLSELHERHAQHTAEHIGERAPVPASTKYSLTELLNSYANGDESRGPELSASPLDEETKKNITRTLSLLEGKGDPPRSEVDNETLLSLFGHMRRGIEKSAPNASLADNAAAAQKFLAREDSVKGRECPSTIESENGAGDRQSYKPQLPPLELSASKWSDSTASVPMASFDAECYSPRQTVATRQMTTPELPPQRSPPEPPQSIGYPSRVPSKANKLIGPGVSGTPSPSASVRRLSSPTLGKRAPGSVRTARETLHQVRGGFARSTAATESKKAAKMPTSHTRPLRVPESGQRGRRTSIEKPRKKSEGPSITKAPRARSKSRIVLDKLNGLFSGRREKRASAVPVPPVPSIAELGASARRSEGPAEAPVVPHLAKERSQSKLPTGSCRQHPAMQAGSHALLTPNPDSPVDSAIVPQEPAPLQDMVNNLLGSANRESDPARKERLMSFAKVLSDSIISARQAQINAETARAAADRAQMSYEITQKSVAMLQRLAATLNAGAAPRR